MLLEEIESGIDLIVVGEPGPAFPHHVTEGEAFIQVSLADVRKDRLRAGDSCLGTRVIAAARMSFARLQRDDY
jgi:hypothetical protein